jgi:hypothetical protein
MVQWVKDFFFLQQEKIANSSLKAQIHELLATNTSQELGLNKFLQYNYLTN